jgi:hypothetical protein
MRKSWTAAAILVVLSAACTRSSEPLAIHDPAQIQQIEVTQWRERDGQGYPEYYRIEDRKRIESVIALLRSTNAGYRVETHWANWVSRPKSREQYTLHFQESVDTAAPLSVSIGADWLSGIDDQKDEDGQKYFRTRPLSGSEREAFVALIARRPEDRERCCG